MNVKGFVRTEHRRILLPGDQVFGFVVSPKFDAAFRIEGGVLIKNMVFVPKITQAVGIVQPAHRRGQVNFWPPGVRGAESRFSSGGHSLQIFS